MTEKQFMEGTYKVVIADDDPAALELAEAVLMGEGYELAFAPDGLEALELCKQLDPHVVVLDLYMPRLSGLEVLRKVKQRMPRAEVIIVTVSLDQEPVIEAMRLGAFDYLVKPVRREDFRKSVKKALEQYTLLEVQRSLLQELREQSLIRTKELTFLNALAILLYEVHDPETILKNILEQILEVTKADGGLIYLLDPQSRKVSLTVHQGLSETIACHLTQNRTRLDKGVCGEVVRSGIPLLIETEAWQDPRANQWALDGVTLNSFLGVPLKSKDQMQGVICLFSFDESGKRFTRQDLEFLTTVGYQVGSALEMKTLLKLIKQSNQRLKAVFDAITDGIAIIDKEFRILAANNWAAQFSGGSIRDLIGKHCYEEFFRRDQPCDGCPVVQTFMKGNVNSALMSRAEVEGAHKELEISGYPLPDADGDINQAVEYLRDVTENRIQERQLYNSEKLAAVGQLAAGIAHELGNALAIIGGSVQSLLKNHRGSSPSREYLEVILRNVTTADRIIRSLLSFARPREPSFSPTDITQVLEGTCLLLKGELAKHHISLFRHFSPDVPLLMADAEQIQQVFLNLLLNAIQAMPEGGSITLTTTFDSETESVRVKIKDTGGGIPQENFNRIFDPFFTTKPKGTGLGLSVSYRFVRAHGGNIYVMSPEGKGTTFIVSLPRIPQMLPCLRS